MATLLVGKVTLVESRSVNIPLPKYSACDVSDNSVMTSVEKSDRKRGN
ncbi:hypothetical protein [Stygiolobus caldivivus]|nr:hypothetical protein [Stygiolobus caldivivus]